MTPTSPYARKARIIIRELDLTRLVSEVPVDLAKKDEVRKVNPLGKIPALQLDDGSILLDSPVICEYLDDLGGGKFFPKPNVWGDAKGRWKALTLQALGDGLADAAVALMLEQKRKEERQSATALEHHKAAILATLDALERVCPAFAAHPTIGEVAVGCALGYVDLRHGSLGWREARPRLAAWTEIFGAYPSARDTRP